MTFSKSDIDKIVDNEHFTANHCELLEILPFEDERKRGTAAILDRIIEIEERMEKEKKNKVINLLLAFELRKCKIDALESMLALLESGNIQII